MFYGNQEAWTGGYGDKDMFFELRKVDVMAVVKRVKFATEEWLNCKKTGLELRRDPGQRDALVEWSPPKLVWMKINSDGAFDVNFKKALAGVVVRNENAKVLAISDKF
ncbi:hypothetical protein REPUB_Repub10bG0071600 [Reevesia pubescens]